MPAKIVTFWSGRVTWLERLSLASMCAAGHDVAVFTPDVAGLRAGLGDLGSGLTVHDVRDVTTETDIMARYREQRYFSLYSDIVRLALLRGGHGVWADADCIFLRELKLDPLFLMGWSHPGMRVNNAVLHLPKGSAVLDDYWSAVTSTPMRAPWATHHIRIKRALAIWMGRAQPRDFGKMSIGPRALTYFVAQHGLRACVSEKARFYPVGQHEVAMLLDPMSPGLAARIGDRTDIVHAWRGNLVGFGRLDCERPPAGSFLGAKYDALFG